MVVMSSSFALPAGILPGQRITVGSRMPPSKVLPFLPLQRAGAADGRAVVGGEDHERVLVEPVSFRVSRIWPTDQSISAIAWRKSLSRVL